MKTAYIILLIVLIGYGSGLVIEAVAEGEQSKLLRLASTGTFDEDWLPFFLDAQMKKIYDLKRSVGLETLGLPNILQSGELHDQQDSIIDGANISFNLGVVKTVIDGKTILQNVVDTCYFHSDDSFGPMCVICKILDKDGQVVGAGMIKEDQKRYRASDTIEIKLTPVRPSSNHNGDDDEEDDDHDYDKDHNDEEDYRKYFDNKDFNKYFNKEDFKKYFTSNEFKKYSYTSYGGNGDHNGDGDHDNGDDNGDGDHDNGDDNDDCDDNGDDNGDGSHNGYETYSGSGDHNGDGNHNGDGDDDDCDDNGDGDGNGELPNDVQKVEGVKVILCKPPSEGCTPGFWKQKQHFEFWKKYKPEGQYATKFYDVFKRYITIKVDNKDVTKPTLLQALNAQGGCVNALARHSVAALLNAASGIGYPYSEAQIIQAFQTAFDTKSCTEMEKQKNIFELANEAGCPFGDDECDDSQHKENHKKYYEEFEKDYYDNKKYYSQVDYKKYLDNYKEYFDDNRGGFDKYDFKQYMDYYKKYLDNNKNYFSKDDYNKYDNEHKKYSNEYPEHDDDSKCDDETPPPPEECKGISLLKLKYYGYHSGVKIEVWKGSTKYTEFSSVSNNGEIIVPKTGEKLNESLKFKIFKNNYLKDEIYIDVTCSKIKDVGYSYKGSKGYSLTIQKLEKVFGW